MTPACSPVRIRVYVNETPAQFGEIATAPGPTCTPIELVDSLTAQ
jgi:hypothetical protein